MRKLKRSVARARMKKAGWTQLNKKIGGRSKFAEHWREFIKE